MGKNEENSLYSLYMLLQGIFKCMKKWAAARTVLIFAPTVILVCPQNFLKEQCFWRPKRLIEPSDLYYNPSLPPQ